LSGRPPLTTEAPLEPGPLECIVRQHSCPVSPDVVMFAVTLFKSEAVIPAVVAGAALAGWVFAVAMD
jgi:hypothetical protein